MLWLVLLPYVFTGAGVASNQLVLIANHGKFPVMMNPRLIAQLPPDADGMIDEIHCVMTHATRLNFLADVFFMRGKGVYSVGDALLLAGVSLSVCKFVWFGLILYRLHNELV